MLAPSVWAQTCTYFDDFKDNGNGTVTDPRSNTVWQRCAVGQSWNGSGCAGEGKEMSWWDAMRAAKTDRYLAKADWRLPTVTEAGSIVGQYSACAGSPFNRAVSTVFQPLKSNGELGRFWTTSQAKSTYGHPAAHIFAFNIGNDDHYLYHQFNSAVRFVRAGHSSAVNEFNRELSKLEQEATARIAQTRKLEQEAAADAQKLRDQAAANAANEARNNAQACGRLYAGKPVKLRYFPRDFFGRQEFYWAEGVIIGMGNGMACARVTVYGRKNEGDGYSVNSVHERACSDF